MLYECNTEYTKKHSAPCYHEDINDISEVTRFSLCQRHISNGEHKDWIIQSMN